MTTQRGWRKGAHAGTCLCVALAFKRAVPPGCIHLLRLYGSSMMQEISVVVHMGANALTRTHAVTDVMRPFVHESARMCRGGPSLCVCTSTGLMRHLSHPGTTWCVEIPDCAGIARKASTPTILRLARGDVHELAGTATHLVPLRRRVGGSVKQQLPLLVHQRRIATLEGTPGSARLAHPGLRC